MSKHIAISKLIKQKFFRLIKSNKHTNKIYLQLKDSNLEKDLTNKEIVKKIISRINLYTIVPFIFIFIFSFNQFVVQQNEIFNNNIQQKIEQKKPIILESFKDNLKTLDYLLANFRKNNFNSFETHERFINNYKKYNHFKNVLNKSNDYVIFLSNNLNELQKIVNVIFNIPFNTDNENIYNKMKELKNTFNHTVTQINQLNILKADLNTKSKISISDFIYFVSLFLCYSSILFFILFLSIKKSFLKLK